ncbi:Pex24p-domain-containing protein [Pseudovirgaria hyperparasitica]|uniref:Pex24p-domain-containing protein n=1 Tax=Pseudovirgaria hyperparasitica TaxID=470096 RepID=A0A6A6WH92_9PEZI|nr:Pex24p-domain-containing protein [Pseudovirgaria hyperparasitica]KAF2761356.1 Pex24p-domain-containing protein [Pseudovirgaria hyperparasitica]
MSNSHRNSYDGPSQAAADPNPPTYAAFAPSSGPQSSTVSQQRSTILVHQKSPLLVATPPQVTRVLAFSHPFILTLSKIVGLITWTTGDPWESFLMVAGFWLLTIYGDLVVRWAGPLVVVVGIIIGMYSRRYSPLSSTGWTGEKQKGHRRGDPETTNTRHHKSLEEIVNTVKLFTSRCNILLDPFLRFTDFLSTQRTATSATTRPALTTMFIRILLITPVWILMTLPPLYLITTKRVILSVGTVILSWHSRPARVSRLVLWRSKTVRKVCATVTGLNFESLENQNGKNKTDRPPPLPPRTRSANAIAASLAAKRRSDSPGIRFTFSIFENQRRWLGIGWTASMLAYERAAWTDETLFPAPSKDAFDLPEVEGGHAKWRWVDGSIWRVDGAEYSESDPSGSQSVNGWLFYDNKWRDGRRGLDGWGRYTRRRKWYRDAELVEISPSMDVTPSPTPRLSSSPKAGSVVGSESEATLLDDTANESDANSQGTRRRRWFRRSSNSGSMKSGDTEGSAASSRRSDDDNDLHTPVRHQQRQDEWNFGDEARMQLG